MSSENYSIIVGSVMFAIISTRQDLAHSINVVSRFISKPRKEYCVGIKWILCYIKRTLKVSLIYRINPTRVVKVEGLTDVGFIGDLDYKRSILGCLHLIKKNYELEEKFAINCFSFHY